MRKIMANYAHNEAKYTGIIPVLFELVPGGLPVWVVDRSAAFQKRRTKRSTSNNRALPSRYSDKAAKTSCMTRSPFFSASSLATYSLVRLFGTTPLTTRTHLHGHCLLVVQKVHSPNPSKEKRMSDVVRIGSIIICLLGKLWTAKFFILRDGIFLVRLQEKFDIDHSWEWMG